MADSSSGGRISPLAVIYLILLVDVLGFTCVLPILPFYAEHFGATPFAVGLLGTLYAVCQLFSGPILGMLSDRHGRRPYLLLSQAGTLVSFGLMAWSPSLRWLYLARALDGATAGNVSVAHAYVADGTHPNNRARAFAAMSTVFGIGFIVGPSLAGYLFRFGYRAPILAAGALSLLSLTLTFLFLKEPVRPKAQVSRLQWPWRRIPTLFQGPAAIHAMRFAVFAGAFSLYFFGLPLFAERRFEWKGHPFGPSQVGVLFLASGAISLLIQGRFIKRWIEILGEEGLARAGFAVASAGYLQLALGHSVWVLIPAIACVASGNAVLRPALTALVSKNSDPHQQGLTMGALQSFYSLADIGAPLLAGGMIGAGWLSAWALAAASLALAGLAVSPMSWNIMLSMKSSER